MFSVLDHLPEWISFWEEEDDTVWLDCLSLSVERERGMLLEKEEDVDGGRETEKRGCVWGEGSRRETIFYL